jgi:titin
MGSYVGVTENGGQADGNAVGVKITDGARCNVVGGSGMAANVISGNRSFGVELSDGAVANRIEGNILGMNAAALTAVPNLGGGILMAEGAADNVIGGIEPGTRNIVSGNSGAGVVIRGPGTIGNRVIGNEIGLDSTARQVTGNQGWGISIEAGAQSTTIGGATGERNIIAGNDSGGVCLRGFSTRDNSVIGNHIGLNRRSLPWIGNGTGGPGVAVLDGASENEIGSSSEEGNVISGHTGPGILIAGPGTTGNRVFGNRVGTDTSGTRFGSNSSGIVVSQGASLNQIGGPAAAYRNILSGNTQNSYPYGTGVTLLDPGTSGNIIAGNYIGTDRTGSKAVPNRTAGIIVGNGATRNTIGGDGLEWGNLISGNGLEGFLPRFGRGIHIFGEGTSETSIRCNLIGVRTDGIGDLPNDGAGVAVVEGASDNVIGDSESAFGNVIARNASFGIAVEGTTTRRNTLLNNRLSANDSLGIGLFDGANDGISAASLFYSDPFLVTGSTSVASAIIDVYLADEDPSGAGEGETVVGSGLSDAVGSFRIFIEGVNIGDMITAIVTDPSGNSSAFADNIAVEVGTDVAEGLTALPERFTLHQNYPNPFNPATSISFTLPAATFARLCIYSITGQKVTTLVERELAAGEHRVTWNGRDESGNTVSSGVYLYRLTTEFETAARKMILLK